MRFPNLARRNAVLSPLRLRFRGTSQKGRRQRFTTTNQSEKAFNISVADES
jgi:hypothetical protein